MPLTTGSESDPDHAIFVIDHKTPTKLIFLQGFFCLLIFKGTFKSYFKDKKAKRGHKTVGINVFLTIFA
jgi:hypothetical protein